MPGSTPPPPLQKGVLRECQRHGRDRRGQRGIWGRCLFPQGPGPPGLGAHFTEGPIQARPSPKSVPPGSPPRSPLQDPALGALGRGLASGLPSGPPFPAQSAAGLALRGAVLPGGGALGAAGSPVLLHWGVRWAHWQLISTRKRTLTLNDQLTTQL